MPRMVARQIEFGFSEHPDLNSRRFTTWSEANLAVSLAMSSAPQEGSAKTDFTVTWEDGQQYAGCLLVQSEGLSLTDHLIQSLTFFAGLRCPEEWSHSMYADSLQRIEQTQPMVRANATTMLESYQLWDESTS